MQRLPLHSREVRRLAKCSRQPANPHISVADVMDSNSVKAMATVNANGIWGSGISREQLLQKISLLAMLGGVREGLREHVLVSASSSKHILTVEQEAEIANNLAFLSRRRHDPRSVAAVAIEENEDGQGMTVRLCVNGETTLGVEEGLKEICRTLEQISQQRMPLLRERCSHSDQA
jgi:hypothetical protein